MAEDRQLVQRQNRTGHCSLIAIILIFLAGMVPLAATRVIDSGHLERYYTDGALSMLQSNDFLTPDGDAKSRERL